MYKKITDGETRCSTAAGRDSLRFSLGGGERNPGRLAWAGWGGGGGGEDRILFLPVASGCVCDGGAEPSQRDRHVGKVNLTLRQPLQESAHWQAGHAFALAVRSSSRARTPTPTAKEKRRTDDPGACRRRVSVGKSLGAAALQSAWPNLLSCRGWGGARVGWRSQQGFPGFDDKQTCWRPAPCCDPEAQG
uniref:Uncharacterized protein n=1 Tax=Sphaerodactylus townsendi TaxID=933632 RepID=A0ACB8F3L3_9SAUR